MPLFVDHVGLNTLISEEIDTETNTRGAIVDRIGDRESSLGVASSTSNNPSLVATGLSGYPTQDQIGFSFWINLDSGGSTGQRYIMYATSGSTYANLILLSSNKIFFYARSSASAFKSWSAPLTFSSLENTWKHVYISWSGDFSDDPHIYVDNNSLSVSYEAGTATGTTFLSIDGIRLFDHNTSSPNLELEGRLQSFAIYSDTFEPPEAIAEGLYNNGVPLDHANEMATGFDYMLDFWLLGNEPQFAEIGTGQTIGDGTILVSSGGSIGTNLTSSTNEVVLREGTPSETTGQGLSSDFVERVSYAKELAAINTHRNGPYGYSTWKQLRVSENPITRYHNKNSTLTFVTQPGPVLNLGQNGELRIRSRYSSIYNFREPAIAQKTHPLVWNVGRHFKDEDGNVDLDNPQRFSIISSYGNQQIGFANERVDKLLKFDPDEEQTEYSAISAMYLENGLNKQDSPLTYWEFLQYRETVFPHMKNQFQNENLERPTFESFYRHKREDRTKDIYAPNHIFGWDPGADPSLWPILPLKISSWALDEEQFFLTREYSTESGSIYWYNGGSGWPGPIDGTRDYAVVGRAGEGELLSTMRQFISGIYFDLGSSDPFTVASSIDNYDAAMAPGPLYMRRISLENSASVSNPSGMEIYGTGSTLKLFQGGALWEAGDKRYIKDENGEYVHAPKKPFYDTYEHYIEEARRKHKNYSVVPEFRMSTQVEDYRRTNNSIELDMFEVTGGVSGSEDSSKEEFYTIYSNSDFMRNFEVIDDDHKDFTNGKVLSLRCKAVKKFLPYEGFYPAQRTVDLTQRFYDSFKDHIKLYNANNVELNDFNFGRQMVMTPLFAPGVLFNTIKSGVAVDYPIITGSMSARIFPGGLGIDYKQYTGEAFIEQDYFDKRIPFEALVEPHRYLSGYNLTSNEPHPSGNLSASANWDGDGDELYGLMMNNFLAEVPEFFLPNGELTSVVSKKQGDITLKSGSVYGMRVKMKRSMESTRGSIYHSGSSEFPYYPPQDIVSGTINRETFTMYSRPSSFGPPSFGLTKYSYSSTLGGPVTKLFHFDEDGVSSDMVGYQISQILHAKDSLFGYNFPFSPPYYHGESWCDITITASSDRMTISEIQEQAEYSFTRFDSSFYELSASTDGTGILPSDGDGPQSYYEDRININAVQLSASLNLKGIGRTKEAIRRSRNQELVVDSGLDEENRWIIQTKFETPMLNFAHVSGSDHLTLPDYGSGSVPRGMWHQHGRIPEENEGVFLEVGPIERNYLVQAKDYTEEAADDLQDLSEALGFAGTSTKIGRLASSKTISEAVVAVPFIEKEGSKKFFRLAVNDTQVQQFKDGDLEALTTGEPQSQIGRSVLLQMQKMEKFVFPPSFDFLRFPDVDPVAMYVFEFTHTLSQQDLSDIWQNLPPDIGTEMEVSEVAITHPLIQKELLGQGGEEGNQKIDMPNKLQWMVFKVKQRAATNYFKKTVLRNPDVNSAVANSNVTKDEFGDTSPIQYNWPYDFFSLVELVKIDAEVELGNADFSEYTDNLPSWDAVSADRDKIEYIVGGMEDEPVPEVQVPDETPQSTIQDGIQVSTQVFAGMNIGREPELGITDATVGVAPSGLGFSGQIQSEVSENLEWQRSVIRYFRREYRELEKKLLVSKNEAKRRAYIRTTNKYQNDPRWTTEFQIEVYNSVDTGGNASVTLE